METLSSGASPSGASGRLCEEERQRAADALRGAFQEFEELTAGMPEAAWRRKAAPEEWSPLELLEHLIYLEKRVGTMVVPKLLSTEAVPVTSEAEREQEKVIAENVASGENKIKAPPQAQPTGACEDWNISCAEFRGLREQTIAYVTSTEDPLRAHRLPHPFFGPLDGYQWIWLLAAHHRRHNKQLGRTIAA